MFFGLQLFQLASVFEPRPLGRSQRRFKRLEQGFISHHGRGGIEYFDIRILRVLYSGIIVNHGAGTLK